LGQISAVPSVLQTEILEIFQSYLIKSNKLNHIFGRLFTTEIMKNMALVFRKTDNENLSLFLESMFLKIVKSKSGVANPIDISYLTKNRENLLQNFKLLPVFHEMLDFENDKSVELVAKCLAKREELWHKFFTVDKMAKRHYIKLFLKCCKARIDVPEDQNEKRYQFESKYPEKLVDSLLYHSLPGLNDPQGQVTGQGHVTKTILKGKFEEVSDMFQVFQNVLILIGQQKKRIPEDILKQSSKLLDIELSNRLPSGSNVLSILNRASQSAVSTKKDGEKAQALITIRSAVLYLKEFCNLSSVSAVPFEKMLQKVHHDLESVSTLIEIIKTRVDDILFFKGKPSPFETLIQLYYTCNSEQKTANEIADLISAILHAPAVPFLAGQISPDKFISLAKRTSDQWSSSKWLSNLKSLLSDNLEDLISSARSDSYNNDSIPTILSIILCSETSSGGKDAKPEFHDFISKYLSSYLGWVCDTEDNTNVDSLIKYCSNFSSIDDKMKKKLESDWSIGGKAPPKNFDNVAKVIWWTRKFNVEDEEKCISKVAAILKSSTINLQEINALKSRLKVFVKFIIQTEKSLNEIFENISNVDQNFGEEIRVLIWNELKEKDRCFYLYNNFWPNIETNRDEFFNQLEIMKPKTILQLNQILEYIGPIKIESKTLKDVSEDQTADQSDGELSNEALKKTQAEFLLQLLLQFCIPENPAELPALNDHIYQMLKQNPQLVNGIQFIHFYNLCILSTNQKVIKLIMELASFDSFLLENIILDENVSFETRFNLLEYVTDSSFIENSQLLQILENKPSDILPKSNVFESALVRVYTSMKFFFLI
jgi:hypothetical protein